MLKLTGDKKLDKALGKLEAKVAKKVLRKAIRKAAKDIQKDVKDRAPRDSGELAKGIKVRSGPRSRSSVSVVVNVPNEDFKATAAEYGVKERQPKPFIRPAFDSTGPQAKDTAMKGIRDGIESEAEKLRRGA